MGMQMYDCAYWYSISNHSGASPVFHNLTLLTVVILQQLSVLQRCWMQAGNR